MALASCGEVVVWFVTGGGRWVDCLVGGPVGVSVGGDGVVGTGVWCGGGEVWSR